MQSSKESEFAKDDFSCMQTFYVNQTPPVGKVDRIKGPATIRDVYASVTSSYASTLSRSGSSANQLSQR